MITVLQPGAFSTVQDEGRSGYQAWGMPLAGAIDPYSFRLANLLAGNEAGAAAIEMTGEGAAFYFDERQLVSISGAPMQAHLDGIPVENWTAFWVAGGSKLVFQKAASGYRSYLAVYGGIDVPLVMGSRSTCISARIGGLQGRCLQQGDVLCSGQQGRHAPRAQGLPAKYRSRWDKKCKLQVILDSPAACFSDKTIQQFFSEAYAVAESASRIACQLTGAKLPIDKKEIISDAVSWGAVEISGGLPCIVMPDHGTIRGFAKIGCVMQADFSRLAQAAPGSVISFAPITRTRAVSALRRQREKYDALEILLQN